MKRSVRRFGWYGTVVGAFVLVCGLAGAFVPLVVIGLVLVGAGVWNLHRPSITGLIVDGVVMILTGLFNCVAWQWIQSARASNPGPMIFSGLLQIMWGIRRLALYPMARRAADDPAAIARLESLVSELSKRDMKVDPTVAEFRTGRFHHQRNRLGLYAEGAIGLLEHQAVRLEKRADIWIEASGTTWRGRSIKIRVQMSDLQMVGVMPAEHFERFERWKLGLSQARRIAA